MRRPLIGARISKLSWDKGNKVKKGHGGLPRKRIFCVYVEKKKKGRMKCEEGF
jgi:hypothetical protein